MTVTKGVAPAFAPTTEETLKVLRSSRDAGLSEADAATRLATEGPNEVPEERSHPILRFAKKFWGVSAWMIRAHRGALVLLA